MSALAHHAPIEYTHKIRDSIIFAIILAAVIAFVAIRGIQSTIDTSSTPTQQTTNQASGSATQDTGASTNTTDTPADRTVPSPSGSDGNSLLNN